MSDAHSPGDPFSESRRQRASLRTAVPPSSEQCLERCWLHGLGARFGVRPDGGRALRICTDRDRRRDTVTIPGTFSSPWNVAGPLQVGTTSAGGTLVIQAGGNVVADGFQAAPASLEVAVGTNSVGTVRVTGSGAVLRANGGEITVGMGTGSRGSLIISSGGQVIGAPNAGLRSGNATIVVDGAGSLLSLTGSASLDIGWQGVLSGAAPSLTLSNGGTAERDFQTRVGGHGSAVIIGAAAGASAVAPGTLATPILTLDDATSRLVLNHTDAIGTYAVSSVIGGVGQVHVHGGTTSLTGNNTYSGGTVLNGGVLRVANNNNLGAANGSLSFGGGVLNTTSDITSARPVTLGSGGATFDVETGTTLTLNGAITGTGGLLKTDAGTLFLTNTANAYTGGTAISRGTLVFGSSGAGALGSGTVTLGDAGTGASDVALLANYGNFATARIPNNIVVSPLGTGTVSIGSTVFDIGSDGTIYSGTLTLNRDVVLVPGNADRTTFEGQITGVGNIAVVSSSSGGRISLGNNSNNFIGDISIAPGAFLQSSADGAIPRTTDVTVDGRLGLNTGSATFDGLNGSSTGVVDLFGTSITTLTVGAANGTGHFAGVIGGGNMSFTKSGAGTQTLSDAIRIRVSPRSTAVSSKRPTWATAASPAT